MTTGPRGRCCGDWASIKPPTFHRALTVGHGAGLGAAARRGSVRAGILAIDDTGLPKQGTRSVGVQRQYCGALGKIGNCQVAVSSALIADGRTWPLACDLYIPLSWTEDAIEDFELASGEAPYDIALAVRVAALDGRHPNVEARAKHRVASALTPHGRLFIDGGDPLLEISLDR